MPDDLPNIDPNLDAPLPNVPANSDLVPYRLSRTDPGGQPVVTTGYGPRGRPPIQPPGGGGAGFPDMDRIANAAFSQLPVDQAVKAVEAASRYLGQRGYQRDLASGANAAQAFAKWAPMMFRQATGIPEAIERTVPPPITPQQMIQNRLNQAKFEASQAAQKAKLDAAKVMTPYQQAEIDLRNKAQEAASEKLTEAQKEELKDAYTELNELRKQSLTLSPPERSKKQADKDKWFENQHKMLDVRKRISKITSPPPPEMPNPAAPTIPESTTSNTNEVVKTLKNGKKAVFDADTKKFLRYADGQ